jgi:orotidine-5'-phosphate decarboxylase
MQHMRERLILALDVENADQAMHFVGLLRHQVGLFKIGLELFVAEGPALVKKIVDSGCRVFLDLKLHDIPNQVAGAAASAARLGISMLTFHALGGWKMLERASEAVANAVAQLNITRPKLLGVTILTSMDSKQLRIVGIPISLEKEVHRLACIAEASGLDGVVASPHEVRLLRQSCSPRLIIVTPGIRLAENAAQDQARVSTPQQALQAGSDYLVIGRPILKSSDPVRAAQNILDEMALYNRR